MKGLYNITKTYISTTHRALNTKWWTCDWRLCKCCNVS